MSNRGMGRFAALAFATAAALAAADEHPKALFGDLHVHTRYSFDAYLFGTQTTPDDAYRFAKGAAIPHSAGFDIQLERPLDFFAVTDHAFYLGMFSAWQDRTHPDGENPEVRKCADASTLEERSWAFRGCFPLLDEIGREEDSRSAWEAIQEAAIRHNDPGNFTTFIAYEYTSSAQNGGNLHRNVFYRGEEAPPLPFSRLDSLNPEDLWAWMDKHRDESGIDALAIPHNSNGSGGTMFDLVKFEGAPLDAAYAEQRMRNEPLVEITQIKGTSDTHPFLSLNDEWADFEIMPYHVASWVRSKPEGSYVREAWMNGLAMARDDGFNPYRFGVIGSSDTHNSGDQMDEDRFVGKLGKLDNPAYRRGGVPAGESEAGDPTYINNYYRTWSASGLAGVWAPENTRDAIFEALRRKETFGTSGPRIKARLMAGNPGPGGLGDNAVAWMTENGIVQGGEIAAQETSPAFLAWAMADPVGTKLQRLQVIKGWVEGGRTHEKVFDVACSDGLAVDPETHRCPDNGAEVNIEDCSITEGLGDAELSTVWSDPEYRSGQSAFYYVRVLENPTCRWSTWDALRTGVAPRTGIAATIQERAWTSPIWVGASE